MITVTIEKSRIKASGHAGAAPKGQDLVCAAFTMLCHSLIESFRKLTEDSFIYKIDSGSFYFECALPSGQGELLINSYIAGVQLLEASYPEYITVQA